MQNVILVIHILACIALTAVVLLQRSEGGALGIGGGGPGGGLMSGRGAAGALARTTMIFAGVFFLTSLTLTTIAARSDNRTEGDRLLERDAGEGMDLTDPTGGLDPNESLLDSLGGGSSLEESPLDEAPVEVEAPAVGTGLNEVPLGDLPAADPADVPADEETPENGEADPQ